MVNFSVSFEPAIPRGGAVEPPSDPDWPTIWQAVKDKPEYDMTFTVCGRDFGYDKSDLMGVLGDILLEIEHLDSGVEHLVSMSGYTILRAKIDGAQIIFIDPALHFEWHYKAQLAEVRTALVAASKDVWLLITSGTPLLSA